MASEIWFTKRPCQHCPYRRDVEPFLTPERGEELAYLTENPYTDFPCHKTLDHDEDGESMVTGRSLTCAGFLTMQVSYTGREVEGFTPSYDVVYSEAGEMAWAYGGGD